MAEWTETRLWAALKERSSQSADALRTKLKLVMPDIVKVLGKGETAPGDFTLHDEDHGFRVVQRMVEIMTPAVLERITATELALLLLSAYLHDIGMTPAQKKVRGHYDYLLTGTGNLTDAERKQFQQWLDDHAGGIVPPIAADPLTPEVLHGADYLITHYARSRHNDWSDEWIREHLSGSDRELYRGWIDDIVALCRSHHEGYDELVRSKFDPKLAGPCVPPDVVHLRHLAAVLRVADILEFDPERTPDVIFHHREVSPASALYWEKDHNVALLRQGDRLLFQARPTRAAIHKAIETMADEIDAELDLCWRLKHEGKFGPQPLGDDAAARREWSLEQSLQRNIQPAENTYEYVDGSFRPNTTKLLDLLSGNRLYDTPFAAVRELLQNAFDAVLEKIAYQRLNQRDGHLPQIEELLAQLNRVTLEYRTEGDRAYLVCTDTGVGMTRSILTNQFLVSGSSRPHRLLDLGRRCREKGFELGRTGEFGIGALSYFMIADQVEIITRRAQEPGDLELNGWQFTTNGIGSFGELRKTDCPTGSTVRLRLKKEVGEIEEWQRNLVAYVDNTVVHVPCAFELQTEKAGRFTDARGWRETPERLTDRLIREYMRRSVPGDSSAPLPPSHISAQSAERERRETNAGKMRSALRWQLFDCCAGGADARCRVALPYWELPNGVSLTFFDVQKFTDEVTTVGPLDVDIGFSIAVEAWKGFALKAVSGSSGLGFTLGFASVDWTTAIGGDVRIDRTTMTRSERRQAVLTLLKQEFNAQLATWLTLLPKTVYTTMNHALARIRQPDDAPGCWFFEGDHSEIRTLRLPAVEALSGFVRAVNGATLVESRWHQFLGERSQLSNVWQPAKIGTTNRPGSVVAVWDTQRTEEVAFPPEWQTVAAVILEGNVLLNRANPIGRACGTTSISELLETETSADAIGRATTIDALARIFVACAVKTSTTGWQILSETAPETAAAQWKLIFGHSDQNTVVRFAQMRSGDLVVIKPGGAQVTNVLGSVPAAHEAFPLVMTKEFLVDGV